MRKSILLIFTFALLVQISNAQIVNKKDSTSMMVNIDDVFVLSSFAKTAVDKPVVLSNVTSDDLLKKLSNQEFPEILKYTPSIYATKMGGGFGDSRVTLRGFGSENIPVLINGVPINGMENGSVYWSNWAGLSDIAYKIQVQRGIGLSKLGLFSVGGTINIVTKGAEAKRGGWVQYGVGNDGYQKMGISLSTGESSNGWAMSIMGTRVWGNGYVDGTEFNCWTYFANISKKINDRHALTLSAIGSPQWHNRRSNKQFIEDYENHPRGIRMNTAYGYIDGKVVPTYSGYNKYHKPQVSLTHLWHIGERASLSTAAYVSLASGGGRKVYGKDANRIQYNYKNGQPNYDKDGKIVTNLTETGLIDYAPLMKDNSLSTTGSNAIFTMGTNAHNWYGLLSTFTQPLGNYFTLSAGLDVRYYRGFHYDEIEDLLGGDYYIDNKLAWMEKNRKLQVGDKVSQDYYSEISNYGLFSQLEYNREHLQVFVSASGTNYSYRRVDKGKYGEFSDQKLFPADQYKSAWRNFIPYSLKAGVNYRFTSEHRLFANGGYITKAPALENIYTDNTFIADPLNEKIGSFELGYSYTTSKLMVQLNGYYTQWLDKSATKPIGAWNGPRACIPNLDALHRGVELEASYTPIRSLRINGFFTYGDWRWTDDVNFTYVDENGENKGEYNAYIKDLKVGNAPQTSGYLAVMWNCVKGLEVGADFNYYARHYADFSAIDRTKSDDRTPSWKLPNYSTVDLNLNYNFKIARKIGLSVFGNVNNLFNKKYIAEAVDGVGHNRETALVWYGFGTTWSVGARLNF